LTESNEVPGRIILGSGRSGTTWVQDCLAEANCLRPIFEPLHEGESELGERFAYRMLPPGQENDELERYFRALAEGCVRSRWIDYRGRRQLLFPHPSKLSSVRSLRAWLWVWRNYLSHRPQLRTASKRQHTLIKCIRANLMAGWLSRDLGFRTVLLVRHPCASVESQYRSGAVWNPEPVAERYRSDICLHEATDGLYLPLLSSRLTVLQALTLNWVIENQAPVAKASVEGYTVAYYEDLRARPSLAWPCICAALGLSVIPSEEMVEMPSQQSYGKNSSRVLSSAEPRWRRAFSADQLSEIQAILDTTECDLYNVSDESPLRISVPVP
jgi:hypothetical protein